MERRLRWPRRAIALIEEQAEEIAGRYTEELQEIADRLAEEMVPLEESAERVLRGARLRLEGMKEDVEGDLPKVDGEEAEGAASGWLYDSRRGYFEQLSHYTRRTEGPDDYEGEREAKTQKRGEGDGRTQPHRPQAGRGRDRP
jgi:hypothetical protein